jgi:hypothetical protein
VRHKFVIIFTVKSLFLNQREREREREKKRERERERERESMQVHSRKITENTLDSNRVSLI